MSDIFSSEELYNLNIALELDPRAAIWYEDPSSIKNYKICPKKGTFSPSKKELEHEEKMRVSEHVRRNIELANYKKIIFTQDYNLTLLPGIYDCRCSKCCNNRYTWMNNTH